MRFNITLLCAFALCASAGFSGCSSESSTSSAPSFPVSAGSSTTSGPVTSDAASSSTASPAGRSASSVLPAPAVDAGETAPAYRVFDFKKNEWLELHDGDTLPKDWLVDPIDPSKGFEIVVGRDGKARVVNAGGPHKNGTIVEMWYTPNGPNMPQMPKTPTVFRTPQMPGTPQMPKMPELPALPEMPALPKEFQGMVDMPGFGQDSRPRLRARLTPEEKQRLMDNQMEHMNEEFFDGLRERIRRDLGGRP